MKRHLLWNRRQFLRRMGYFSALSVIDPHMVWSLSDNQRLVQNVHPHRTRTEPLFAYVGSWEHGIQVFAVQRQAWILTQTIASSRPAAFDLHPNRKFLYAVNAIDTYQGLPTGTAEAYKIDTHHGRLTLLNRQPLSLSAITPRHLAVSPDGRNLIVAVGGGGSYNVLPIEADGFLGKVSGILKETGSGPDQERQNSAHPQMVMFDTMKLRLLSADLGSDRLNVFTLAENGLVVAHRSPTSPGSGPRSLALHPSGRLLYVMNELNASISCFNYDVESGRILDRLHHQSLQPMGSSKEPHAIAMAMHSSGNFLYTSYSSVGSSVNSSMTTWRIDSASGQLKLIQKSDKLMRFSGVEAITPAHDCLFVLGHGEGVFRLSLDPASGILERAVHVARVSAPRCMTF